MGQAPQSNLPTRLKFSWDAKSPPWTDGKGDQEEYRDDVKLWQTFHSALPDSNSNKIPAALQAVCLKSQLYGRAKDLCSGISEAELVAEGAVNLLVGKIYQKDALSIVSEAYRAFNQLWNTRRGSTETMKNFESRFSAQVAKFYFISATTKLPECITALMLLSNSAIDDSQRVSVMAAAAPSDENLNTQSSNDEFLKAITYQSVSSVIKQCDKASHQTNESAPLSASSAGTGSFSRNFHKAQPPSMKYPCDLCGKYGHWKRNHRPDGSLPSHYKSFDSPQVSRNNGTRYRNSHNDLKYERGDKSQKKVVRFNMATLSGSSASGSKEIGPSSKTLTSSSASTNSSTITLGPLLDDGAPYAGLGAVEHDLLSGNIGLPPNHQLDPIPESLNGHTHWQYGTGAHASPARRILGSIVLTAKSDQGRPIEITHLVLDGSSQWVIGRNVTSKANIEHIGKNALVFLAEGKRESISLVNHEYLSCIELNRFTSNYKNSSALSCLSAVTLSSAPWSEVKRVIDKLHKHVCGHASFTDNKLLFERNGFWNDTVASYVFDVVNRCSACRSAAVPQPNRKVSKLIIQKFQ